jgi:hypothetical protein
MAVKALMTQICAKIALNREIREVVSTPVAALVKLDNELPAVELARLRPDAQKTRRGQANLVERFPIRIGQPLRRKVAAGHPLK